VFDALRTLVTVVGLFIWFCAFFSLFHSLTVIFSASLVTNIRNYSQKLADYLTEFLNLDFTQSERRVSRHLRLVSVRISGACVVDLTNGDGSFKRVTHEPALTDGRHIVSDTRASQREPIDTAAQNDETNRGLS